MKILKSQFAVLSGHTMIYWMVRGNRTGMDCRELTEKQLKHLDIKYHDLKFGKPSYDLFIDDKNINAIN